MNDEAAFLKKRLWREKEARKEAERIIEQKSLELYHKNAGLRLLTEQLEDLVAERTARLNETLSYMKVIIDNIIDGLLVTDINGSVTSFNPSLIKMFVLGGKDIAGKRCLDIFPRDISELMIKSLGFPDDIFTKDLDLPNHRSGRAVSTAIQHAGTLDEKKIIGVLALVRDVTLEKEVDQMKTDFISTVTHELRTPLTSILGFTHLIKKKFESSVLPAVAPEDKKILKAVRQIKDNLEIILSEGKRLTYIINDVLDVSKMESGKTDWRDEPISISGLIERSLKATSYLFEEKGLAIATDIAENLPATTGDMDRLMQVMINLFSNAVKFTKRGTITCKAEMAGDEIVISVTDTGTGIAKKDQQKIFDKFKQVSLTVTDKPNGTGLGLAICKQVVEHYNGRIWVESDVGMGSTFFFSLPVTGMGARSETVKLDSLIQRLKEHVTTASSVNEGKTILIVDDDPNIRELLRQELESEGYTVRESPNGLDAISQVKQERPNLIILDVMMPEISGFDVAAVIKNDPLTMNIPIIILSIIDDKERGYCIGVDSYFTKPVNIAELIRKIESLISQGVSRKKVMVIDEDESAVRTLTELLEAKGFSVLSSCNGKECIEKAVSVKPDMIIIDTVLSDKHDIVKTLRFQKGFENVYFVFLAGEKADASAKP